MARPLSKFLLLSMGCLVIAMEARAQDARKPVRFATFNASLNRDTAGRLVRDLSSPDPSS